MTKRVSILDEVAKVKLVAPSGSWVFRVMEPGFTDSFSTFRSLLVLELRAPSAFDSRLFLLVLCPPKLTLVCIECECPISREGDTFGR